MINGSVKGAGFVNNIYNVLMGNMICHPFASRACVDSLKHMVTIQYYTNIHCDNIFKTFEEGLLYKDIPFL